jgi:hypothetical protein
MADVRKANREAGCHWFDKETMEFWKTRIESKLLKGGYFISSEEEWTFDGREGRRLYSARLAKPDGRVSTIASLLSSKEKAWKAIKLHRKESSEKH